MNVNCERGQHEKCWGLDGRMDEHPDSLPRCSCPCHDTVVKRVA